jgi:hypothetical protein
MARLRITESAVGWVMAALIQGKAIIEQNRNYAKGSLRFSLLGDALLVAGR